MKQANKASGAPTSPRDADSLPSNGTSAASEATSATADKGVSTATSNSSRRRRADNRAANMARPAFIATGYGLCSRAATTCVLPATIHR